jgi:hypothetical protein
MKPAMRKAVSIGATPKSRWRDPSSCEPGYSSSALTIHNEAGSGTHRFCTIGGDVLGEKLDLAGLYVVDSADDSDVARFNGGADHAAS